MTRTWKALLLVGLAIVLFTAAISGAQTTTPEPAKLSDQLLAFFGRESNAVMAAIIVPLIWKFFPAFKNFSNTWMPVVAAASAFIVHALAPPEAGASLFGDVFRTSAGILFPVVRASIDSAISKWAFEHFLRGPTSEHWTKPTPTK